MPPRSNALVLFDIDGTLIRRAGPHHRQALVQAILEISGIETTTDGIALQGMLDRDIVTHMMARSGAASSLIRRSMPEIVRKAQSVYARGCPDLRRKVCPGVRRLLKGLRERNIVTGLVTGNLTAIAWKKMEHAGLKPYFEFGAFAEMARDRGGLVRIAIRDARRQGWIERDARVTLIGDHENDVRAARVNGIRSIAVATGISTAEQLASENPDLLVNDLRSLTLGMILA